MAGSGLIYLFAAYLIIWLVLAGYIFFVSQQVADLRGQIRALRQERASRPASDPNP